MPVDPFRILHGFEPGACVVLVAAHPDDEILGAGCRLSSLPNLTLVHVTDGAPRNLADATQHGFGSAQEYSLARREELQRALVTAGADPELVELGVSDQEAALQLHKIVRALCSLFRRTRPDLILTHPYEGGHPDHDATALAVHAAWRRLCAPRPFQWEFTSYHSDRGTLRASAFLPSTAPVISFELSAEEREQKRKMLACFASQQKTLRQFPVEVERFREAPQYNFTEPPHSGTLYYEQYAWGLTGARFCELAGGLLQRQPC